MAHTVDAVVYDPATGYLQMIVIPDDDRQLSDPAFNPPGMTQLRVPLLRNVVGPTAVDVTTAAITRCQQVGVAVRLAPAVVSGSAI
jgi:hypothetical protein